MSIEARQQGITHNGPSIAAVAELELVNFKLRTNE